MPKKSPPKRRPEIQTPARPPPTGAPETFLVVGLGASAGGLEAFQKFFNATPADSGMAFILIQHLDPTHESLMVELLSRHTKMRVQHAGNGMRIEPNSVYIIPPGSYLSVRAGTLCLSQPHERHGARLPFDFLLLSLAEDYGARAACIILSGTGSDGALGLKAVHEHGGLIIAQAPQEAAYAGMPESAISTRAVDFILPISKIPPELDKYARRIASIAHTDSKVESSDELPGIIDLLRTKTPFNFTLYKKGTLQRRIERRMAMAPIETNDPKHYLEYLDRNTEELNRLGKDFLINVTNFFRNPEVFDYLATVTIPDMLRRHADGTVRVWIAACSTGEEAYSIVMLFREHIEKLRCNVKLQIFASDIDPDAVAFAREGLYPETIEADVSPERLARFFVKENDRYRISSDLRASIIFAVQDILSDPPFARIDFISCRNLLIYLRPEAQTNVLSLFHFSLRPDGVLLLGNSETVGKMESGFEELSRGERIYRRIGVNRSGTPNIQAIANGPPQLPLEQGPPPSMHSKLAEISRQIIMDSYAPTTIVTNSKFECLYSMGQIDRYLAVTPGRYTQDVTSMARDGVRIPLHAALQKVRQEKKRVLVRNGIRMDGRHAFPFSISAQPLLLDGEELTIVSFIDEPETMAHKSVAKGSSPETARSAELERELQETKAELQSAIRNLEFVSEAQKVAHQELLSVNEEYQSTNEELLTSKEELQSLNEELTALNSQLLEALERERTTANDLQNILYSTDIATLFLDKNLNIRYFTPATSSLFRIIAGDIGRPLTDLASLSADTNLVPDAKLVMLSHEPQEREIETRSGTWFMRRIFPYRTDDVRNKGVVITFSDTSKQKEITDALVAAQQEAQQANAAKSRFLAAASHDLRQPLQTLVLLHGILTTAIKVEKAQAPLARVSETLIAMSGMLNALLNIDQIETGKVVPEKEQFFINDLLGPLKEEFDYHAAAKGLELHVVPSNHIIRSDSRLLEQVLRNLLANALKYTGTGKVLLGCRVHDDLLSIEVWDTGPGIPDTELNAIFNEYYQLDNHLPERNRGLGLGLAIVQKLLELLGHQLKVRSRVGKGSVFSVCVPLDKKPEKAVRPHFPVRTSNAESPRAENSPDARILVIEDDPELRAVLKVFLHEQGYKPTVAAHGPAALEMVVQGAIMPDVILADLNLPRDMDGLETINNLRDMMQKNVPAIIMTGDISAATSRRVLQNHCVSLHKPVESLFLLQTIRKQLESAHNLPDPQADIPPGMGRIYVIDDNDAICSELDSTLTAKGFHVATFGSAEAFLDARKPLANACVLIDAQLPGMQGLELMAHIKKKTPDAAIIIITGFGDTKVAVEAMKAGALDFIMKPIGPGEILASIEAAFEKMLNAGMAADEARKAAERYAALTPRQREVLSLVLAGAPSKNIAADLHISQRTVENHRAAIMKRFGAKTIAALVKMTFSIDMRATKNPPS